MRLVTDRETGQMKGYGYVEFNSEASADSAISTGGYELDGRELHVDKAGSKPSFGGDRGGRGGGRGFSRGRGGDRGGGRGRGGSRGRGAPSPGMAQRKGAIQDFAGKKTTFGDSD